MESQSAKAEVEQRAPQTRRTRALGASFPILELRQYTLHEGHRDRLIDLFEQHFVEPQEQLGMKIIGTFRDLDQPDRFVWLRGFENMDSRLSGLTQFYDGEVWRAHREDANATMIDSDNVLLVHAPCSSALFQEPSEGSQASGATNGIVVATICHLDGDGERAVRLFEDEVKAKLEQAGVTVLAWFVSVTEPNNYPRLPVREGEQVLLWFSRFEDRRAHERSASAIAAAQQPLTQSLTHSPQVLRLEPTQSSKLR